MMLDKYVSPKVIFKAGFNWYEPSYSFDKGNLNCRAYHSYLENRNLNIIVIETMRKNNRKTGRFYFFTIEGKPTAEFSFIVNSGNWSKLLSRIPVMDNSQKTTLIKRIIHNEEREFFEKLRKGVIQQNKVSGKD